jgi:hypothetical protein
VKFLEIKKFILDVDYRARIIRVAASCGHYKQAEALQKELKSLGFKNIEKMPLHKLQRVSGEYMTSFDEELDEKLNELEYKGWIFKKDLEK